MNPDGISGEYADIGRFKALFCLVTLVGLFLRESREDVSMTWFFASEGVDTCMILQACDL